MKWIIVFVLLATFAAAECIEPTDGMTVSESVLFCSSTYDVPSGITIAASNVVLDCGTAVLRGILGQSEIGLRLENVDGVTVKNCNVITFNQGIYLKNVTNSLIEDNAVLKNRIGIRLLDSFENTIRDNNDKSYQLAVSAINSKYNIVIIGNKEIERSFCEVNACNEFRDMNVCESGDFYCSKKCSAGTDADCAPVVKIKEEAPPEPSKSVEEIIEEVKEEVEKPQPKEMTFFEKQGLSLITKFSIYIVLYVIAFIVIQKQKR